MKESKGKKLFAAEYLLYDFAKLTAAIPGLIAFRPKIIYQSETAKKRIKGAALLIGNHTGFFDPVYMQFAVWYRRHHFICLKEFFEGKQRFFFKNFLCIPIDRENFGFSSFREIIGHLKQGELVSMFPEGKIEDDLKTFKSGMVLMALQSGAPIIPMYIKKRGSIWKRLVMAIGEPLNISEICGGRPSLSRIEEIAGLIHDRELQLKEMCERGQ